MQVSSTHLMRSASISIILLSSGFPRYRGDSASIFIKHLAVALAKTNIDVHVIAPGPGEVTGNSVKNPRISRFRYFIPGLDRLAYGSGILPNLRRNPLLWLEVPFFMLSMFLKTLTIARRIHPDVIHAHWVLPQGAVALIVGFILNIPVVTTVHGTDVFGLKNRYLVALKRYVSRCSNAWTSGTDITASTMSGTKTQSNYTKIPMGVDIHHFANGDPTHLRTGINEEIKIVLFVGRLIEMKGVDILIKAFAMLPPQIKENTILWIVGEGNQKSILEKLASSLGIQKRVNFHGHVDNDRLPDYYAAADLFVGPSTTSDNGELEGQGIVFVEAAAGHLCVLSTNSGGIPEVITNGETGILVEPDNIDELCSQMTNLLSNNELRDRLTRNAYKNVCTKYSWNIIANQFKDLYLSIKK